MALRKGKERIRAGWREWVALPGLGIPAIKAKLDTGARTSALHAFSIDTFRSAGRLMVRFGIHPLQQRRDAVLFCEAEVLERRKVMDSGGHGELRYVIRTPIRVGQSEWDIEITLANRDAMRFRMLLGRTAMQGRILVDPEASYRTGRDIMRAYLGSLGRERKK